MLPDSMKNPKLVRRLNATLPDPLARFVGEMTGKNGLYETPSEFIRDLIRRYMENTLQSETQTINALLIQSLSENNYTTWDTQDLKDVRNAIRT